MGKLETDDKLTMRPPAAGANGAQMVAEQELARVVVAAEAERASDRPWHVTLRPWLFCLLFLALIEGGVRVAFDHTLCLRNERFDNFPNPATEDVWTDQIRRDPALRVVVIGDSTVVGASLLKKNETIPAYLERALQQAIPGRPIHVWNLGVAGARSTDQYCLLLKVLEAKPDFVVVTGNYTMFSQQVSLMPLAYPWLARNLPQVPPEIRALLDRRSMKTRFEDWCQDLFERSIRLIGMRQAINGILFGVQPHVPVNTPNPAVMITARIAQHAHWATMRPWYERTKNKAQWAGQYRRPIGPDNFNGRYYRPIFDALKRSGTPAVTYLTPQNPSFVQDYLARSDYDARRSVINRLMSDPQVPHYDFSNLIPSALFYDNDHLLATGNKIVADALAARIAPTLMSRVRATSR